MTTPATTKTDLLLLGLLLDRPMHGYELYQQIQAEGIDAWYNISAAGVYYSLRKLRDQGSVAESRQHRGGSSHKSIYRLMDKGRSAFFEAMDTELASQEDTCLDYDLVIYLLNRIPLQRAILQLQKRQSHLAAESKKVQAGLAAERDNGSSPLKIAIMDHKRRFIAMESDWLADVIRSVQAESDTSSVHDRDHHGLMSLSGDLGDLHLPDMFRLIVSGRHSGTLSVTDGTETRTLSFEDGQPVCASYLHRGAPPVPQTSCDEVLQGLCELFRWREGRFSFDQTRGCQDWCVPVECSTEELILRGCRKVDNWDIIQRLVPSADTIFELGSAYQHLDRLTLVPVEEQVLAAVDGIKDVGSIARDSNMTLFDTSRAMYCLAAIGVLRTADLDKIRLRHVFREIAELMCGSTLAWRSSPDDRSCEEEVSTLCKDMNICLEQGTIRDETDPQLETDELQETYQRFLQEQFKVVSRRFGQANARQSYEQTLYQLAPELQDVANRYGFDRIVASSQ